MANTQEYDEEFFASLLGDELDVPLFNRGIRPGSRVKLYVWDTEKKSPVAVGTGVIQQKPNQTPQELPVFRSSFHGHELEKDMVVIRGFAPACAPTNKTRIEEIKNMRYPYTYNTQDEVPEKLGNIHTAGFYVWNRNALIALHSQPNTPTQSQHSSEPPRVKKHAKGAKTRITTEVTVEEVSTATQQLTVVDDSDNEEAGDNDGRDFNPKKFDSTAYLSVRMRLKVSQIRDFETPLRRKNPTHVQALQNSFTNPAIGYDTTKGVLSVTALESDEAVGTRITDIHAEVNRTDGTAVYTLPENQTVTVVDGRHRREALEKVSKMKGKHFDWSRDYTEVSFRYKRDLTRMTDWEVLMLSSTSNQVTSLVYESTSVADVLRSIESYSVVFRSAYNVSFFEAKNSHLFTDIKNTHFLGNMPDSTIKRYIRWSKAILRFELVKEFLFNNCEFSREVRGKQTNINYFMDNELLSSDEKDMLIMFRCADAFYQNRKGAKFYTREFYSGCRMAIETLRSTYNIISSQQSYHEVPPVPPKTFDDFLVTQYTNHGTTRIQPMVQLMNILQTFDHNPDAGGRGKNQTAQAKLKRYMTNFTKKLFSYYGIHDPNDKSPRTVPGKAAPSDTNQGTKSRRTSKRTHTAGPLAVIALDIDEPPVKKRRTRLGAQDPSLPSPTQAKSGSVATKKTPKQKKAQPPLDVTILSDSEDKSPRTRRGYDDSFDPDTVPPGYETNHSLIKHFERDVTLSIEDIMLMRVFPSQRNLDNECPQVIQATRTVTDDTDARIEIKDTSVFLRSIMIPKNHRAELFVSYDSIRVYRLMACLWACFKEFFKKDGQHDLGVSNPIPAVDRWNHVIDSMKKMDSDLHYLGMSFFQTRNQEFKANGYTILDGMGDPFALSGTVDMASIKKEDYGFPEQSNGEWFLAIENLFPGERYLQSEDNRTYWNPIVNTGNNDYDRTQRDMGIARYQSTNAFVTELLEKPENVHLAKKRAHVDVWIGILASFLSLDNITLSTNVDDAEHLLLPVTGGRFLYTGWKAGDQTGHNDFAIRPAELLPGVFVILTGPQEVALWVMNHSHKYVFYPDSVKKTLCENLRLEKIIIPGNSVFFGHGYLHHAGSGWSGSGCLRYHTYLRPDKVDLPDAIHFSLGGVSAHMYDSSGAKVKTRTRISRRNTDGASSSNRGNDETSIPRSQSDTATKPGRKTVSRQDNNDNDGDDSDNGDESNDDMDIDPNADITPATIPP